jgi:hypothetical protein
MSLSSKMFQDLNFENMVRTISLIIALVTSKIVIPYACKTFLFSFLKEFFVCGRECVLQTF